MKKACKKLVMLLLSLTVMFCMASPVSAATINKKKVTLCTGQSVQLKINGTKRKPKWYSSNKKVAIVNQSGKVTAKGKGSAVITAKIGKAAYKCSFRVESPKISKTSISLYKGKTYQLKMLNTKQKYKWSSKNRSIATVTSNGKVTGKKTGTTYIYAKSASGKTFKCKVTVKNRSNSNSSTIPSPNSVTYHTEAVPNGEVIIFRNHNNYAVSVDVSCAFYRNKQIVSVRNQYDTVVIEGGRKYAMLMWNSGETWDSVKLNLSLKNVSFFNFNAKNISYTSSRGTNGVILTVKNNGKSGRGAHMAVVYYKNGKIIGCDELFANVQSKGSIDYIESRYPTDEYYNTIIPDKYEVYVNMCYSV